MCSRLYTLCHPFIYKQICFYSPIMKYLPRVRNLLASALMTFGLVAGPIPVSAKDSNSWQATPSVGFGYRTLKVGDDLDDYVDKTRQKFEPSMPGFKDFMQLSHQLPYLAGKVDVATPWHIFSRDSFEFTGGIEFSSSEIFGGKTDKKTYDASLSAIEFGDTPSTWSQNLDWYGAVSLGVQYSPIEWGQNFKFRPLVNVSGGVSYLDGQSILHIQVKEDPEVVRNGTLTWEAFNSVGVYKDIYTDADSHGRGYFVVPKGGFAVEWNNFILQVLGGYRYEKFDYFVVDEKTTQDGQVKTKSNDFDYDASGLDLEALVGYKF